MADADGGGRRSTVRAARVPDALPPPPPRPPLSSGLAPPAPRAAPRAPGTVRAAAWCWCGAVLSGAVALCAAAADLAGLRRRLADAGAVADPGASDELLREGADTAVLAVLGPLAVLTLLGLVGIVLYLRRRAGWRRVLGVLGLLVVATDVLAQDLLGGGPEVDRGAVLVQCGLVLLALLLLALRPSRAWSRHPRR